MKLKYHGLVLVHFTAASSVCVYFLSCLFSIQSRCSDNYSFPSTKWSETCTTTLIHWHQSVLGPFGVAAVICTFTNGFHDVDIREYRYGYCWPVKINGIQNRHLHVQAWQPVTRSKIGLYYTETPRRVVTCHV